MEAPDRVFFTEDFVCGINCNKSVPGKRNVEYIRKEALMEWATTNRDKLDVLSDNDAVRWGQRNAFQQMIDKLNSM